MTLRDAARAGLLAMVGAPVAAIMEAMKARRSMSRSPSRDHTLSPQSTLRSNISSRDISFDTDRSVNATKYVLQQAFSCLLRTSGLCVWWTCFLQ